MFIDSICCYIHVILQIKQARDPTGTYFALGLSTFSGTVIVLDDVPSDSVFIDTAVVLPVINLLV